MSDMDTSHMKSNSAGDKGQINEQTEQQKAKDDSKKHKKHHKSSNHLKKPIRIKSEKHIEEPSSIFKKRHKWRLNDNFLVSREESEKRLQTGCLGLAIFLSLVCTILVTAYAQTLQVNLPIIVTPNKTVPPSLWNKLPVPHIAVIYNDGSVYDVSLEENISPSENLLIKLPGEHDKLGKRYAYQDQIGTLYFISSTISRPITQYHHQFGVHSALSSNYISLFSFEKYRLNLGTQIGNKLWLFGMNFHEQQYDWIPLRASYIWYTKRQRWSKGPVIPDGVSGPWACTGINATSAAFVSFDPAPARVYLFDFEVEEIFDYPQLPNSVLNIYYHFATEFALTTLIRKTQRILYCGCLMNNFDSTYKGFIALMSYVLDQGMHGEWAVEHMQSFNAHPSIEATYMTLTAIRGLLYSFNNFIPNQAVVSVYQNGSWLELNSTFSPGKYWPVFAMPHYVRVGSLVDQ